MDWAALVGPEMPIETLKWMLIGMAVGLGASGNWIGLLGLFVLACAITIGQRRGWIRW